MEFHVTEADTAIALGSGDVPVLATPRLLAWMETATVRVAAVLVAPTSTTVGAVVRMEHLLPTGIGGTVAITATTDSAPADRRLTFSVEAVDGAGQVVARAEITRAVVDRERFLRRVTGTS